MPNLTLAVLFALTAPGSSSLQRFEFTGIEMAVPIRMVLYAEDEATAEAASAAAFKRIRQLNGVMSDYDPTSEVRRLAATAGTGKAVRVSDDLWQVLRRSKELAERTDGAFDVTVEPLVRLWRRARRRERLPDPERLKEAKAAVDYRAMQFDPCKRTVRLTKPDMGIDLGGIAKGYAIDAALEVLAEHGVRSALVDAGGDIGLGAAPPGREGWVIGVAALERGAKPDVFLSLSNVAIATSGDSWQFVEIDGKRYSHLVDPRTGIGLTDHSSVTVIAPDAMTADGLASAASVLGPEAGLELVDATRDAAALIVRAPKGQRETFRSARWDEFPVVEPDGHSQ